MSYAEPISRESLANNGFYWVRGLGLFCANCKTQSHLLEPQEDCKGRQYYKVNLYGWSEKLYISQGPEFTIESGDYAKDNGPVFETEEDAKAFWEPRLARVIDL